MWDSFLSGVRGFAFITAGKCLIATLQEMKLGRDSGGSGGGVEYLHMSERERGRERESAGGSFEISSSILLTLQMRM